MSTTDIRYIRHCGWPTALGSTTANEQLYTYVAEHLLETWIPADRSHDWLLCRTLTGRQRWLVGDESMVSGPAWPTGEWRALYGDFRAADEHRTPQREPTGTLAPAQPGVAGGPPATPGRS